MDDNSPLSTIRQKRQAQADQQLETEKNQSLINAIRQSGGETKDSITAAMHDMLIASLVGKDPRIGKVASALDELINNVATTSDNFKKSNLEEIPNTFKEMTRELKSLPDRVAATDKSPDLIPYLKELTAAVSRMNKPAPLPMAAPKVDMRPLVKMLEKIDRSIRENRVEVQAPDLSDVEEAVNRVERTIRSLKFPVPNYILPFKDVNGRAVQVQLDADGNVPIVGGGSTFIAPTFSTFTMTGQTNPVEVGTTLTGSKTFTWATTNSSNILSNSIEITQGSDVLASSLATSGSTSATITDVQKTTAGSQIWTITGTDTNNDVFNRNYTINWYWRMYYGTSTDPTLDEAGIEGLVSSQLSSTGAGTYSLAAGGYKYFCYPTSLPAATAFIDNNTQFLVSMAAAADNAAYSNTANGYSYAIVSVTNSLSQTTNYRVYRTRNQLGGSITVRIT